MQVYAAGFDTQHAAAAGRPAAGRHRHEQADSEAAIRALPGGVTLAFSPYAQDPSRSCWRRRARPSTNTCCRIPMEPQGFPLNDPGDRRR